MHDPYLTYLGRAMHSGLANACATGPHLNAITGMSALEFMTWSILCVSLALCDH